MLRPHRPLPPLVIAAYAAALAGGCTPATDVRPGDIRTYSVAKTAPSATPAVRPTPRSDAIRYDVPAGWSDRGASGMRLATLAIGDPADGLEVTVIPAAGTLRSNVDRWQGQLDANAPAADRQAAVERAIAAAEAVDVGGTPATVVTLFDAAAAAAPDAPGQAILGAMIPVADDAALFAKFKGDAAVARRERDAFIRFVASLRWQQRPREEE